MRGNSVRRQGNASGSDADNTLAVTCTLVRQPVCFDSAIRLRRLRRCAPCSLCSPLVATTSPASASRWAEVATGDNLTVYADTQSIRRSGQKVRVWLRWVYQSPVLVKGSYPQRHYQSQKTLEVYHCENRSAASLQMIRYAEPDGGEVVESLNGPDAPEQHSEVTPESVGEGILEYACKSANVLKR